jgi:hypothetical protein
MSRAVNPFDALIVEDKSFVAMLLDYSGIDRKRFASVWIAKGPNEALRENSSDGPLFSHNEQESERKQS